MRLIEVGGGEEECFCGKEKLLDDLKILLNRFSADTNTQDCWMWNLAGRNEYTTKEGYKQIGICCSENSNLDKAWANLVWIKETPQRLFVCVESYAQ